VLALYLRTLAPSITWAHFGADGGDLISAAYSLGVPHPTGYPAYIALGHLFAQLPVGNVAFRLNLMSAVGMAGAAGLITLGILRSMRRPRALIAALGGLSFAAAPMAWGQATIAEVYALNALFAAALSSLLIPIILHPDRISSRSLAAAFFLWGLGLGNHVTLLFLAPLLLSALRHASLMTRHSSLLTHYSSLVTHYSSLLTHYSSLVTHYSSLVTHHFSLFTLLGLAIYLLVPIRAAAQPPVNWLGEVTGSRVVAFIGGELYRPYAFGVSLSDYPDRLAMLVRLLFNQFGPAGAALIGVGAWQARRLPRRAIVAAGTTVLLYTVFALGYVPPDWSVYLIPVWLLAAYLLAYGAHRLIAWLLSALRTTFHASHFSFQIGRVACGALAVALVPGLTVAVNFAAQDLSADHQAEAFAREVWQAVPPAAIVVTHADAPTFTLWYYRLVEEQRLDTAIVDQRLAGYDWYAPMLHAQHAQRAPILPSIDPLEVTWLSHLRAANPDRVVCDLQTEPVRVNCD
jgi:hypothetical protein